MKWIKYPDHIEKPALMGILRRAVILFAILSVFAIGILLYYLGNPYSWSGIDWYISGMIFLGLLTQMVIFEASHWTLIYVIHKFTIFRQLKSSMTMEETPDPRLKKNTKTKIRQWIVPAIIITVLISIILNSDQIKCSGAHGNLQCIADSPFTLWIVDIFNPVLDDAIFKVKSKPCADVQSFKNTLKVLLSVAGKNVHYTEELDEMVDSVLLIQPKCFLDAAELLDQRSRLDINPILDRIEYKDKLGDREDFKSGGRAALKLFAAEGNYANSMQDLKVIQ